MTTTIGINGFGRIGKLSVWHHVHRKFFDNIVVNIGREVGSSIEDIAQYIERDSTYGSLHGYLYGCKATSVISDLDENNSSMRIDGVRVHFLKDSRNPAGIDWGKYNAKLVVETTGNFVDPTLAADHPDGSVRGHFESGVEKVIVSAPFKIKDKGKPIPEDAVTTVMGINEAMYDPRKHKLISNASCTTVCLAHMLKPLLDFFGSEKILSASMATVHAITGSQESLDRVPKAGSNDLRKNRSILNNIILTSTGAAKALSLVIPEMKKIGFIAESVRVPVSTGSLIILVLNLQEYMPGEPINRKLLNDIYRKAEGDASNHYLMYSDKQNVSSDFIGMPKAAVVVEGHETHTRTGEIRIDITKIAEIEQKIQSALKNPIIRIPVTQSVIYGWYDNEMGGYTNILGDRTITVAESM